MTVPGIFPTDECEATGFQEERPERKKMLSLTIGATLKENFLFILSANSV